MVEIISLIISIICLIIIITMFIIFLVHIKRNKNVNPFNEKDMAILLTKIDYLSNQTKENVELAISKEMVKLAENNNKYSEVNNNKLERFQANITESLLNRFDALNKQMDDKLSEMNKKVDEKLIEGFKGNSEAMSQVRERLQAIDEAQKNIQKLSGDVISLKQVLEGNQSRGQYGEYQLSMVLKSVFNDVPNCYEEQYTMKKVKDGDDVRADAVVFMPEPNKMICIDSKFPFANYSKLLDNANEENKEELLKVFSNDVKKHINAIHDKYIIDGKTAPEAIMFIPNDGIFAFIHHNLNEVISHAREKRVIITSPSTLPAILVTINMIKVEYERSKNVKEISRQLSMLGKQFELFAKDWETFSRQLETASRSREKLDNRVNRITGKFESIYTSSGQKEESSLETIGLETEEDYDG